MSEMQDFNKGIIDEFRANGGKVGGMFAGAPDAPPHHHRREEWQALHHARSSTPSTATAS